MFVTGLIAALVIGLLFALGCLVYKKQWQPKTDGKVLVVWLIAWLIERKQKGFEGELIDRKDKPVISISDERPVMSGYENPAMNPCDDGESGSTKM